LNSGPVSREAGPGYFSGNGITMSKIVTVALLKQGDRFEFLTDRSEWADRCYLPHPAGVIVVAQTAFMDPYKQCRFGWRMEKYPNAKSQDWWGQPETKVKLLAPASVEPAPARSLHGKKRQ
jgi:hypothetical protein